MCDDYFKGLLLKLNEGNNKATWNNNDDGENDESFSNDRNETIELQTVVCDNARVHDVSVATTSTEYSDMPILRRCPRVLQRKSSYRKKKINEHDIHFPLHHQDQQQHVTHYKTSSYPCVQDTQTKKVCNDYLMFTKNTTAFVSITATGGKFADYTVQWNIPSLQRFEQTICYNSLDQPPRKPIRSIST